MEEIRNPLKMRLQLLAGEGEEMNDDLNDYSASDNTEENNETSTENKVEMTQEEFEKALNKRLSRQEKKLKAEFEKQLKQLDADKKREKELGELDEDARRLKLIEERELKLKEKEAQYAYQDRLREVEKLFIKDNLDVSIAEFIVKDTNEETLEAYEKVKKSINDMINKRVEAEIQNRIKGKTPRLSQGAKNNIDADAFLKGFNS